MAVVVVVSPPRKSSSFGACGWLICDSMKLRKRGESSVSLTSLLTLTLPLSPVYVFSPLVQPAITPPENFSSTHADQQTK